MRKSAVVIEVPEAVPAVNDWRLRYTHDAALGMPPHVTLLSPFVPARRLDGGVEEMLGRIVGRAEPFAFVLRRTARWPEIVYLPPEPSEPFLQLTESIAAAWPEHPPYEGVHETVIPHLTVADVDDEAALDQAASAVESQLPIKAEAQEATLFEEGDDGRWRPRRRFALGATRVRYEPGFTPGS